jgi:hypothetical protein
MAIDTGNKVPEEVMTPAERLALPVRPERQGCHGNAPTALADGTDVPARPLR